MPTQNVNLTERNTRFVQKQIESGLYNNASEVHRSALAEMERREEERKAKIEWLKSEAQKGFDQIEKGESTTFHGPEELDQWMDKALQDVITESDDSRDAEPAS